MCLAVHSSLTQPTISTAPTPGVTNLSDYLDDENGWS
jgi:hypothetical protein